MAQPTPFSQRGIFNITAQPWKRINELEIVKPGQAFEWTDKATGLYIKTNLNIDDCNNRDPKTALFKTDAALWAWARRVQKMGGLT